ncbi:MAG TPA: hypothetical protein ENK82_03015 [Campylobacterales bacterium]|nr:hypothetical protein [Campylobacterales bacterium]
MHYTLEANANAEQIGVSLASLIGAILIGVGDARWLTNEVDKKLLKATAIEAADSESSNDASRQIAVSSPAQALEIVKGMKKN